ncbi:hypothetical protein LZ31DRAFT_254785 [Colletotrichum somersetense]|nr:hypothetical protein LZ31DRAFT_254785 [Colletotrichum somersetense]
MSSCEGNLRTGEWLLGDISRQPSPYADEAFQKHTDRLSRPWLDGHALDGRLTTNRRKRKVKWKIACLYWNSLLPTCARGVRRIPSTNQGVRHGSILPPRHVRMTGACCKGGVTCVSQRGVPYVQLECQVGENADDDDGDGGDWVLGWRLQPRWFSVQTDRQADRHRSRGTPPVAFRCRSLPMGSKAVELDQENGTRMARSLGPSHDGFPIILFHGLVTSFACFSLFLSSWERRTKTRVSLSSLAWTQWGLWE